MASRVMPEPSPPPPLNRTPLPRQFAPYKHAFQPYGERGSLDQTELRYGWLRRKLKEYADQRQT